MSLQRRDNAGGEKRVPASVGGRYISWEDILPSGAACVGVPGAIRAVRDHDTLNTCAQQRLRNGGRVGLACQDASFRQIWLEQHETFQRAAQPGSF